VYDNGIARFWNDVVGAIGLGSIRLPIVPGLAGGGIVPGKDHGRDEKLVWMRPEEGVLVPGAARFLGHGTISTLNRMFGGGGRNEPGHYGGGGIIGDVISGLGGLLGAAFPGAGIFPALAGSLISAGAPAIAAYLNAMVRTTAHGELGQMLTGIPRKLDGDLATTLMSALLGAGGTTRGGGTGTPGRPAGTVASWFKEAVKRTGVPLSWIPDLETIGWYESRDQPDAINLTDANARAGTPSQGIMQVIFPTFLAHHQPGTSMSIDDPVANIAAAIRYIKARYGSPALTPGILSLDHGGKYQGYDRGGWLLPGTVPVNRTGRPEAVLTPDESRAFVRIARHLAQGTSGQAGGTTVNQNYYGPQMPGPEQQAIMRRDLAVMLGG
jgi:hypothetical protein